VIDLETNAANEFINPLQQRLFDCERCGHRRRRQPLTLGGNSPIAIVNVGGIAATAGGDASGIIALAFNGNSPLSIVNSADMVLGGAGNAIGINAGVDAKSPLTIENSASITASATFGGA
jgi:hypothetical protein